MGFFSWSTSAVPAISVLSLTTLVAESGVKTSEDGRRLRDAGADAVLVGEAAMRDPTLNYTRSERDGSPQRGVNSLSDDQGKGMRHNEC